MSDCQHQTRGLKQSDVQNKRQPSAEEREKILDAIADCLVNIEKDSDIKDLELCLEQLDPKNELGTDFDVNRSLDEFYQKYEVGSPNQPAVSPVPAAEHKKKRLFRHTARIAIIAATLCSFIVAAQASGLDIFRAIAEWTSEQFHLEWTITPEADTTNTSMQQLNSLHDTLILYDIQTPLAPTVFPEGCQFETISVEDLQNRLRITASYTVPSGDLFITIYHSTDTTGAIPFSDVEKNSASVEKYTSHGITHYIMEDINAIKAVWQNEKWEGRISGSVSHEELLEMIDSIYQ